MKIENQELRLTKRDVSSIADRIKKSTDMGHAKAIDLLADALGIKGGNALMSLLKSSSSKALSAREDVLIEQETEADLHATIRHAITDLPPSRPILVKTTSQPGVGRLVKSIAREKEIRFLRHSARFPMSPDDLLGLLAGTSPSILFIDDCDYATDELVEGLKLILEKASRLHGQTTLILAAAIDFPRHATHESARSISDFTEVIAADQSVEGLPSDQVNLSERCRVVLQEFSEGHVLADVSRRLSISDRTTETFLRQAREALGAKTTAQAVARATALGMIKVDTTIS